MVPPRAARISCTSSKENSLQASSNCPVLALLKTSWGGGVVKLGNKLKAKGLKIRLGCLSNICDRSSKFFWSTFQFLRVSSAPSSQLSTNLWEISGDLVGVGRAASDLGG